MYIQKTFIIEAVKSSMCTPTICLSRFFGGSVRICPGIRRLVTVFQDALQAERQSLLQQWRQEQQRPAKSQSLVVEAAKERVQFVGCSS